jgi:hypothetical protein
MYGDLVNAILFSLILPFVTVDVIKTVVLPMLAEQASLATWLHMLFPFAFHVEGRELGDANVMAIRLGFVLQYLGGVLTIICGYSSFYYSTRPNDAVAITAQRWSYASFFCLVASSAALSLNNVSHPDEQTLPGHFVLNLIVATANIAHSVRVKHVMGAANLLVGFIVVYYCPRLYPPSTFVPLLSGITYGLANYWISAVDHHRKDASKRTEPAPGAVPSFPSTLPIPTAEEFTKQDPAQFMQRLAALRWEDVRPFLAFGVVAVVLLHFLSIEVYITMTQAGYFSTGCFRVCQSAAFGVMGFMASGALRQSNESDVPETVMHEGGMSMVLANLAFDASPTAMAITDSMGRIEKCNPAFVQATSHQGRLDAVRQLVNGEDAERLQRCLDECESSEGDPDRDGDESDCDFLVNGTVLNIRVSLASRVAMGDAEQALAPFSLLGFLSEAAKSATKSKSSAASSKRCVVVINDVTLNRALDHAVYESTALMHNGQSEALMRDMMNRIASTR